MGTWQWFFQALGGSIECWKESGSFLKRVSARHCCKKEQGTNQHVRVPAATLLKSKSPAHLIQYVLYVLTLLYTKTEMIVTST